MTVLGFLNTTGWQDSIRKCHNWTTHGHNVVYDFERVISFLHWAVHLQNRAVSIRSFTTVNCRPWAAVVVSLSPCALKQIERMQEGLE